MKQNKPRLFIDMDQVIVNFDSSEMIPLHEKHMYGHPSIYKEGFFRNLKPFNTSVASVNAIIDSDKYDVHILTQPVAKSPLSYKEKAEWIAEHLPRLSDKITMTHDKNMMSGYMLIDDSVKWSGFQGLFHLFDPKTPDESWNNLLKILL